MPGLEGCFRNCVVSNRIILGIPFLDLQLDLGRRLMDRVNVPQDLRLGAADGAGVIVRLAGRSHLTVARAQHGQPDACRGIADVKEARPPPTAHINRADGATHQPDLTQPKTTNRRRALMCNS
jgi:hypothetical protein